MLIERIVECKIMKGLGPEMVRKRVHVGLDDIEDNTPEWLIKDMVINEAKAHLRGKGIEKYTIEEIHNA